MTWNIAFSHLCDHVLAHQTASRFQRARWLLSYPDMHKNKVKAVAIIGSETGSVYFDPQRAAEDVSQLVNLVMMGDGAAAIVIGPDDGGPGAHISSNFFGQVGLGLGWVVIDQRVGQP